MVKLATTATAGQKKKTGALVAALTVSAVKAKSHGL